MKKIIIISGLMLITGCASTSFENLGKKIDSALSRDNDQQQVSDTYPLTIQAEPNDSAIKIMNIKPKYHDGIRLKSGVYDILVQRDGFETYRKWIKVAHSAVIQNVVLSPLSEKTVSTTSPTQKSPQPQGTVLLDDKPEQTSTPSSVTQSHDLEKQKKPKQKPVKKQAQPVIKKAQPNHVTFSTKYLPPEILVESDIEPAQVDKNDIPLFDGGYIKVVEEGFFSDTTSYLMMTPKTRHKARLFYMKESISILTVADIKKRYFALDIDNTITVPIKKFQGVVAKGPHFDEGLTVKAFRMVMGYNKQGFKKGKVAALVGSSHAVYTGEDIYTTPLDESGDIDVLKTKLGSDSYLYIFKNKVEQGLYVFFLNGQLFFFNLI